MRSVTLVREAKLATPPFVRRPVVTLTVIVLPVVLGVAACGLSLGVDDAGPQNDGSVQPLPTAPPPSDGAPTPDATLGDGATEASLDDGAADAQSDAPFDANVDASADASDGAPYASDASGGDGSGGDASDGGAPMASVSLRFEALVGGRFVNDAHPATAEVVIAQLQTDAPRGGTAPATNVGSLNIGPNTKGWVKIQPAQALARIRPVTKLTISAWVKPEVTAGNATIMSYSSARGVYPLFELVRTSQDGVKLGVGELLSGPGTNGNGVASTGLFLTVGKWLFVAATYDKLAGQACFYKGTSVAGGEATLDACVAYAKREFSPNGVVESAFTVGNTADETVANPNGNVYVPSFGGNVDQVFVYFGATFGLAEIRALQSTN